MTGDSPYDEGGPGPLYATRSGDGPPIVLIHGVAGSHLIFEPLMAQLESHFSVVRPDLLGYGRSPKPHAVYDPPTHLEAIHTTLHRLELPRPFVAVGLSMGVNLVLDYARLWPEEVSGIVGIGMCHYPDEDAAKRGLQQNLWTSATINHPRLSGALIPPIWWLGRHIDGLSRRFAHIYTPEMAKDAMLNPYYAFRSSLWNTMVRNPTDRLLAASADLPRLFVHGSEDRWSPVADIRAGIADYPESRLLVLEGIGHNAVVLDPSATAAAICEFARQR